MTEAQQNKRSFEPLSIEEVDHEHFTIDDDGDDEEAFDGGLENHLVIIQKQKKRKVFRYALIGIFMLSFALTVLIKSGKMEISNLTQSDLGNTSEIDSDPGTHLKGFEIHSSKPDGVQNVKNAVESGDKDMQWFSDHLSELTEEEQIEYKKDLAKRGKPFGLDKHDITLDPTAFENYVPNQDNNVNASALKPELTDPTEEVQSPEIDFDGASYKLIETIDHDESSFTQGLTYADGILYESAGLYKQSTVRRLNPATGEILQKIPMDGQFFAEGMAYYGEGKLIQITWKKKTGFIYNATNLDVIKNFTFSTTKNEGWGITYDEGTDSFIVSDGSNMLHFWDRETLEETHRVEVIHPDGIKVSELNELEFWNGLVLSNVWYQDIIYAIDPVTGNIVQVLDFNSLWPKHERSFRNDVFNGISITDVHDELLVTGKKWPKMYRIKMNLALFQ